MLRWLEQDARTDTLTGLHNRHAFDEEIASRCEASKTTGDPVTLVVASVVGRAEIAKTYGDEAGDELLRRTSTCVTWCIRGNDFAARVDPDTVAVLLAGADINVGQMVARRIVHRMHQGNADAGMRAAPIDSIFGIASRSASNPDDLVAAAMTQVETQRSELESPVPFVLADDEDGPSVA